MTFINPQTLFTISYFCLEFHDPFLLCSDGFTLINLKVSCCDHFIFCFSSYYYMKLYQRTEYQEG